MKRIASLALAIAAVGVSVSARADNVLDVSFSGVVSAEVGLSTSLVNSTVTGQFLYDTTTQSFQSFTINGQSVAPGFQSLLAQTPDTFSSTYTAQVSPVTTGGTLNSTFALDLESLNGWPETPLALLTDSNQLATNLDTPASDPGQALGTNSSFNYYIANANGTNVTSLTATLESISVQVNSVPEPGTYALMLAGLGLVCLMGRRRKALR